MWLHIDSLLARKKTSQINCLELYDCVLSLVFFGPLAILYWASTWDIFYYYAFNTSNLLIKGFITLTIGLTIHFNSYMFQYELQNYHDKHFRESSSETKFYKSGFLVRSAHTYVISI